MIQSYISKLKQSEDNTKQRNARLLFSIATSVFAKFITIGSTLITMPLTLHYLGAESFGVWMVISGVVGFMGFSDLGVGMGLQNALSKAYGKDDKVSPKHYIANAYCIATALVLAISLTLFAISSIFPIEALFKIDDEEKKSVATLALKYSVLAFLTGIPIALIQRVLGGLQKTYVANNVLLVGSLLSLTSILASVYFDWGLVGLSVLFVLSPTVVMLVYSAYFFYKNPSLRVMFSNVSKSYIRPIVSSGVWTVVVQIIYTVKMNVPIMIVSASLGLLAVAEFSIAQKLTGLAATMISIALQPLWVVYGEAYYRGDRAWVEMSLRKSIKVVLALSVSAAIVFQFLGQELVGAWLGDDVVPSLELIFCFSLWMIASNINICFAMLINGTGNFKRQAIYSFCCVCSALGLSIFFVDAFGSAGVIFTMFLVSELLKIPLNILESRRILLKTASLN
ncbi:MAG: lipopolysaccharide biosynthesis protein [Gammaproteobacteria bacterium]|nr:lipopolysaccharide biosynthesis protein [Gammaproteobacteria bacterium]